MSKQQKNSHDSDINKEMLEMLKELRAELKEMKTENKELREQLKKQVTVAPKENVVEDVVDIIEEEDQLADFIGEDVVTVNSLLFGNTTAPYSNETAIKLLNNLEFGVEGQQKLEIYLLRYFAQSTSGDVLFWDHNKGKIIVKDDSMVNKQALGKLAIKKKIGNREVSFGGSTWFFKTNPHVYKFECHPHKPICFIDREERIINSFPGWKFTERRELPNDIIEKAARIWKHVFEVMCNSNLVIFDYVSTWISHSVCSGKKLETCLYVKSIQGSGKSFFTNFLKNKVIPKLVHVSAAADITDPKAFRSVLIGKVLLVLEEAPTSSTGAWDKFSGDMKHFITGEELDVNEKHKTVYQVDNICNCIIITNNNAIKITPDDRRYFVCDISDKYVGNKEYFDEMFDISKGADSDEVGEAFFWSCMDNYEKSVKAKWNENRMPITEHRKDLAADYIHDVHDFVKTKYVLEKRGFRSTRGKPSVYSEVYKGYIDFVLEKNKTRTQKRDPVTNNSFSKKLSEIKIYTSKGTDNITLLNQSWEELYEILDNNHLIARAESVKQNVADEIVEHEDVEIMKKQGYLIYECDENPPREIDVEEYEETTTKKTRKSTTKTVKPTKKKEPESESESEEEEVKPKKKTVVKKATKKTVPEKKGSKLVRYASESESETTNRKVKDACYLLDTDL